MTKFVVVISYVTTLNLASHSCSCFFIQFSRFSLTPHLRALLTNRRFFSFAEKSLVGSNGLEPSTSRLSGARSNHLSYEPIYVAIRFASFGQPATALLLAHPACTVSSLDQTAARCASGAAGGGDEQNRTVDPLLARQVLSQLSYAPIFQVCRFPLGDSTYEVPYGPSKLNSV